VGVRWSRIVRIAAAVVAVGALAGCGAYGRGWSAVHADAGNSDYSRIPGPPDVALAWEHVFPGRINLGPTSDPDGRLYVTTGTDDCPLHALDVRTGAELWCSGEVDRFASLSGPLVDRQRRVFVADSEAMHAFDAEGNLLWETPIVGVPLSAQFTSRGRVVFVTNVGVVYVLARATGRPVVPPYELVPGAVFDPAKVNACALGTADCPVANTPAIDLRTDVLYTTFWPPGADQASLIALEIREARRPSVTLLWTNDSLPGGSASSPDLSFDGRRAYVNDNAGSLHALSAKTGREIWSLPIGYAPFGSPSTSPAGLIMPAGGGGAGLVAVQDEGDHAAVAWRRDDLVNRGIPTQSAGGRSYAVVRSTGFANDLVVVDVRTGDVLDREPVPGPSIFTVGTTVAADGTVLVPTITGRLSAYRSSPARVPSSG
jgi:outer membrane protein assembly factor BamB